MTPAELLALHKTGILTRREWHAADLQARGLSERTIALGLGISRRAVRQRLARAERKITLAAHRQEAA